MDPWGVNLIVLQLQLPPLRVTDETAAFDSGDPWLW